jgi:uncharacterized protein
VAQKQEFSLRFSNAFEVSLPPDEAWATLMDIPAIVPCMPGAELTEKVDDRTYKGKVSVRLGPMTVAFAGTARFEEIDEPSHRATIKAQGADAKGRGSASATVAFSLEPVPAGSSVVINTDLNLSGSVAQYGRASGLIQGVASQLTKEFAKALAARIAYEKRDASPVPRPAESAASSAAPEAPTPIREAAASKPISGFGLLLKALWMSLRGLFGGAA